MRTSLFVHHCLQQLKKNAKDDNKSGGSLLSFATKEKNNEGQQRAKILARHHPLQPKKKNLGVVFIENNDPFSAFLLALSYSHKPTKPCLQI